MNPDAQKAYDDFLAWCDRTGWSQGALAEECMTSRAHLNQVLTGKRCGRLTWKRLVKVLPVDGLLLLQHCSAWNKFAAKALEDRRQREVLLKIGEKCRQPEAVAC